MDCNRTLQLYRLFLSLMTGLPVWRHIFGNDNGLSVNVIRLFVTHLQTDEVLFDLEFECFQPNGKILYTFTYRLVLLISL